MKRLYITFAILVFTMLFLLSCSARSGYEKSFPQQNTEAVSQPPSTGPAMLRVLVDLRASDIAIHRTEDIKEFLKEMPGYKESFDIQFEYLPTFDSASERNTEIDRLRLDLMQDKGPDIIICQNFYMDPQELEWTGLSKTGLKSIFNIPQSAMKQRLFLPLDGYIANARYTEWDKLLPAVMDAGKDEKGRQVIVPMTYKVNTSLFEKERYAPSGKLPMSREELLNSGDPALEWVGISRWETVWDAFGGQIDYQKGELAFSEEELLRICRQIAAARKGKETKDEHYNDVGCVVPGVSIGPQSFSFFGANCPEYIMIPAYNTQGGVTASVGVYGAVSRSTAYPEEAFAVLDKLMSLDAMKTLDIYAADMPVHVDMCWRWNCPAGLEWRLSEWNFAQYAALREQINVVDYMTPVNRELMDLWYQADAAEDEAQLEKLVHDSYTRMRMILAES
ncbi:MAG: hypothetical protein HFE96_00395 [Acutalibacter sp.]|nr:hypothetical protein [Acutalibacter sp.]